LHEDVKAHIDNPFLLQPEENDEYALIELQIGMPTLTTLDSVPHNTFSKTQETKTYWQHAMFMGSQSHFWT